MHLICEHPGWRTTTTARHRTVRTTADTWQAVAGQAITTTRVGTGTDPAPVVDAYSPTDLSTRTPGTLRDALEAQGPVSRLRNPDLWDALATGIIRQVIRADQARLMYHRFCTAHGTPLPVAGPPAFPRPETVLALDENDFADLGMKFKHLPLVAAATAFAELGAKWMDLSPEALVAEVQTVPRIGPWTAGAAVADYTGDFSLYPYGDMAVRKYAAQAAPDLHWPSTESAFAHRWRTFAATSAELSILTVLTLALGGHRAQDRTPS
ncbi:MULTISPECIES: hypothetical protein [unclassified Nocardiopsis]|uniref:hypothetical protein n=1 Tax=unclassified Nocardiopsis TaxID=2649073 RepID=UPI00191568A9|nr:MULTISPECIES: hypothetical protein [unclassified Nocardiopsis]